MKRYTITGAQSFSVGLDCNYDLTHAITVRVEGAESPGWLPAKKGEPADHLSVSDGYHTMDELYEHRYRLWIVLCKAFKHRAWKSLAHSDGSSHDGYFVLGLFVRAGDQITYHLPMKHWADCESIMTLDSAPRFDGHTSDDVLERIDKLL